MNTTDSEKELKTVGVIGLGAMGRPMANALLAKKYPVQVYDVSQAAVQRLVNDGAHAAESPRALGAACDIVLTMLPFAEDVERALLGPDGVIQGAHPGLVVIDASTIDPQHIYTLAEAFQARGVQVLDVGVSASPKMAWDRRGTFIVGGSEAVVDACRPVLNAFCENGKLIHAGPLGTAKVVKLVNNMVGAIQMVALSEAFSLAQRAGVEPKALYAAMSGSMGNCWALQVRPPVPGLVANSPADQNFAPDFSVDYMAKDLAYALATGKALGASLTTASLVQQLYLATSARGEGAKDFAAVVHTIEALSRARQETAEAIAG